MSITVVGSVALDTVETPAGVSTEGLGGAATFFSLAAANYDQVHLVGVVGDDFPQRHVDLLASKGVDLGGLERVEGRTFRWSGRYHDDMNDRDTLDTQLNVFEAFHPKLPPAARHADYLFLANIHPALQLEVLGQSASGFAGLDTMNLWIATARDLLLQVLERVNVLIINDAEIRQLTGERNLAMAAERVRGLGPEVVVVKKGEHGCLLFQEDRVFAAPAYPLRTVTDPTGAGDTFAGGFMGHIARERSTAWPALCRAVVHGSAAASFACESFGPDRLASATLAELEARVQAFRELTAF